MKKKSVTNFLWRVDSITFVCDINDTLNEEHNFQRATGLARLQTTLYTTPGNCYFYRNKNKRSSRMSLYSKR